MTKRRAGWDRVLGLDAGGGRVRLAEDGGGGEEEGGDDDAVVAERGHCEKCVMIRESSLFIITRAEIISTKNSSTMLKLAK